MKAANILASVKSGFNSLGFKVKKNSPEILIVTGTVGVIASAVMACKATMKVNDILDETKEQLDKIHKCASDPQYKDRYSEEDAKKDTTIVYVKTGMKFVKLYGPSIALGALSLTGIIKSNRILRKRNAALAAAYAAVDRSFKEYRNRVIERFGNEVDKQLKYNIKSVEVKEKVTDEDGNTKTIKKKVDVIGRDKPICSAYARFFEKGETEFYNDDHAMNLYMLRAIQNGFNDRLKRKAGNMIFLNEVYKELGFPITKAGQYVGWKYDPDNHNIDNYIDFGITELVDPDDEFKKTILLDFNVDGNILVEMEDGEDAV